MDFHSLSRRELQALCKMNKIPANITNLAMADALQALETVEGLEEVLTQSAAGYLETPAKSMTAARSVSRTSKQRTLNEEPDSKLTNKSRRGTRKLDGETNAAPPSACPKVPMTAQSMQKNVEGSAAARVYNTRRSTRLLEKQMCQLSLKDNEDLVDVNADKDSQYLQRQFIQDIDNSLAPEDKTIIDESNDGKEATEEPIIENMDVEDEKSFPDGVESVEPVSQNYACVVVNACKDAYEPVNEKEFNVTKEATEESIIENMDVEEEKSSPDGVESVEQVSQDYACDFANAFIEVEEPIVEKEFKSEDHCMVGITDTVEATQELINEEEANENEADSNADYENSAVPAVDLQTYDDSSVDSDDVKQVDTQINLQLSSALVPADNGEAEYMDAIQMKAPEASEDEFGFLSESDCDIDDEEEAASEEEEACESDDDNATSEEEEEEAASEDLASKSPLMPRDQVQGTLESSSKKPSSVHPVPISDNKENLPAAAAPGTPLERKSLRQLKKMVRGLYKQQHSQDAEGMQPAAPLQLRAENV